MNSRQHVSERRKCTGSGGYVRRGILDLFVYMPIAACLALVIRLAESQRNGIQSPTDNTISIMQLPDFLSVVMIFCAHLLLLLLVVSQYDDPICHSLYISY